MDFVLKVLTGQMPLNVGSDIYFLISSITKLYRKTNQGCGVHLRKPLLCKNRLLGSEKDRLVTYKDHIKFAVVIKG